MAAGDAQRAWFPEMMSELRENWHPQMSWEECADLCQKMTFYRKSIWNDRKIKPARIWCPNCKQYHDSRPPSISIRSMLFALKKIKVIDDNELKKLLATIAFGWESKKYYAKWMGNNDPKVIKEGL